MPLAPQVGCQMGCTFCATGTMGLVADLTAGEIVEQLVHAVRAAAVDAAAAAAVGTAAAAPVPAPSWPDREGVADGEEAAAVDASAAALGSAPCQEAAAAGSLGATGRHIQQHQQLEQRQLQSPTSRQLPIHNVVFMGMGEPLNNWAAVKAAVSLMVDPRVFGLARRRVRGGAGRVQGRIMWDRRGPPVALFCAPPPWVLLESGCCWKRGGVHLPSPKPRLWRPCIAALCCLSQVTVSTVGVIPRVLQLADELPGVSLALSLHAPTQVRLGQLEGVALWGGRAAAAAAAIPSIPLLPVSQSPWRSLVIFLLLRLLVLLLPPPVCMYVTAAAAAAAAAGAAAAHRALCPGLQARPAAGRGPDIPAQDRWGGLLVQAGLGGGRGAASGVPGDGFARP